MLGRTNRTFVAKWWWAIDHYMLLFIALIMLFGVLLIMAASPAVAERIGLNSFYFVNRHMVFMVLSVIIMLVVSMLSPVMVRRLAFIGFIGCIILLISVPLLGEEVKGARRWIRIAGFSLQPSEFIKPFFIMVVAWILTLGNTRRNFPGYRISMLLAAIVAGLLLLQPDFGMTLTILAVWSAQLFIAGLPFFWIALVVILFLFVVISAYIYFPHVADRINLFFDPSKGDNYQVEKSLQAFSSGGLLGQGPGEGVVKSILPDSHTDFIFAVAGEEFGLIFCIILVFLFAAVVVRGFKRIFSENDIFIVYAASGLLIMFGMQAFVNMGVALNILPNTGMTLPFISYGGSSMLSVAITMGMVLAMTRNRYGISRRRGV